MYVLGSGTVFLFASGIGAWLVFDRIASRTADRVSVSSSGLTAVFPGGRAVSVAWTDPSFDATVTDWVQAGFAAYLRLTWHAGGQLVMANIDKQGSNRLIDEARRAGLQSATERKEQRGRSWTVVTLKRP